MKFELNEYHRNTSDNELIDDLKSVAECLGKQKITIEDYNEYGKYHATTLTRRFGSWFTCLEKAGLEMTRSFIGISDEELFDEIENVCTTLGKQPSYSQMRDMARFSMGTYEKRFNGWRGALKAFIDFINDESNDKTVIDNTEVQALNANSGHKTSRTINLRIRFLVLQRDNFKCCACGASPATNPLVTLQVDHIIPWSKGGETVLENLQTLCANCNLGKSDM